MIDTDILYVIDRNFISDKKIKPKNGYVYSHGFLTSVHTKFKTNKKPIQAFEPLISKIFFLVANEYIDKT